MMTVWFCRGVKASSTSLTRPLSRRKRWRVEEILVRSAEPVATRA